MFACYFQKPSQQSRHGGCRLTNPRASRLTADHGERQWASPILIRQKGPPSGRRAMAGSNSHGRSSQADRDASHFEPLLRHHGSILSLTLACPVAGRVVWTRQLEQPPPHCHQGEKVGQARWPHAPTDDATVIVEPECGNDIWRCHLSAERELLLYGS